MRAWIRRHDNVAANIGGLQRGVSRLLKCEVDQAVVHKIDWTGTEQQRFSVDESVADLRSSIRSACVSVVQFGSYELLRPLQFSSASPRHRCESWIFRLNSVPRCY